MYESKDIIKILRGELTLQKRHTKLLRAQNEALVACDRPRFFQLFEGYSGFLAQLEQHATKREECLRGAALSEVTAEWPEEESAQAKKLSDEIKETLDLARQISGQNQKLIARELTYIDFLLNLYVEAGRRSASYAHS
ncbi:MAG TPA: flagellar export chaperone FlgN, partial [Capsulimonadaceae bacterium]|nr:flagellar export chaperone FlgN [Capsulimonadaceae bacterium]